MNEVKKWKGGREPKAENQKLIYRCNFRMNEEENLLFESLFQKSGVKSKSDFLKCCVFNKPIYTIVQDKSAMEIAIKLDDFINQIKRIGSNYNQAVKALHTNLGDKKALAFIYKLEKATTEVALLENNIILIFEEYKSKWLQTSQKEIQ